MNTDLVIITTGGTIACIPDDHGVRRPGRDGRSLVKQTSWSGSVEIVDLMAKDSSCLTVDDWSLISRTVGQVSDRGARGIVITHGTDSLEETALWVELTYDGDVPVVITGAQRSAQCANPDGARNLSDALRVASCPQARGQGVMVCFAGQLFAPLGVQKISTDDLVAFDGPLIGTLDSQQVCLSPNAKLDRPWIGQVEPSHRVDIVCVYPGTDTTALDAYVDAGAHGVVINAMGSGNVPLSWVCAVEKYVQAGIAVVVCSRVISGAVTPLYGPGRALAEAGALFVPYLRAPQARVVTLGALSAQMDLVDAFAQWGCPRKTSGVSSVCL